MRGTTTGMSAVRLPSSRTAAHQRHRHAARHVTTIDAPTRARTPTPTLRSAALSAGIAEPCRYSHAAARLPGGGGLRGVMSTPTTEGVARGGGGATSGELGLMPVFGMRAGGSTIRTRFESASFLASRVQGGRRSRDFGGQEPSRAQPRCAEHHRGPTAGRERQQPPRQPFAPPQRSWPRTATRQRRRPRP
jgi:hypothetical protein